MLKRDLNIRKVSTSYEYVAMDLMTDYIQDILDISVLRESKVQSKTQIIKT